MTSNITAEWASNARIQSPAFVIDVRDFQQCASCIATLARASGITILYSTKANDVACCIDTALAFVDGFSVSSLFEAELVRQFASDAEIIHSVSPVVRDQDIHRIANICDRVTLNSFSQVDRYAGRLAANCEVGVRLNPRMSFVADQRYDPCRENSRLGIPIDALRNSLAEIPQRMPQIVGLHFHSNCDSADLGHLVATVQHIESVLGDDLTRFRWLNLGGGYLLEKSPSISRAFEELQRLRDRYGLEIVMEPGAAFVRSAGYLVATVEDLIQGDDCAIAILDTTVNHWPEVFEYQFEPDVLGHIEDGQFTYQLAGCSCLAGDIFGTYSFNEPLEIGSRVVFENAGAYSIVKASMFNGINLPTIYTLTESGELVLTKQFTYEDFASRCGVETRATV